MTSDYGYNEGRGEHRGGYNRGGRGRPGQGPGGHHQGGHHRGGPHRGVPLDELDPALTELSRRVIGCAIEVHKELGPGYPLDIYRKSLEIEFKAEEIAFKSDHAFEVEFDGEIVGTVKADLFIGDRFLVGIMAEHAEIGTQPRSELRAKLRAADFELGLIINFGERRLKDGLVRVLNPDKLRELRGEIDEDEYEYVDEDEDSKTEQKAEANAQPSPDQPSQETAEESEG